MIELKAYNVVATADVNPEVVDNLRCTEWPAYDKEEADKVIAEKDEELRRQKYRRCLAMAKLSVEDDHLPWNMKWHKRWLELAEKFKHNK